MASGPKPQVEAFFDPETATISYVVADPHTRKAAVIDAVLDYDAASGRTSTRSADRIVDFVRGRDLDVEWILETHAHADHLSAARYLKSKLGGRVGIGERIVEVQRIFRELFNLERTFNTDGRQFDHLFKDGERFRIGELEGRVMFTPGHTPACATYIIDGAAFVGDTLFMPDVGTARADFPGGDARTLYRSIQKILSLPDDTVLYLCHDYPPPGREPKWVSTVAEQKAKNIHIAGKSEEEFVQLRTARDKTLPVPKLLIPSIQINIRAGDLPPPEEDGVRYIKVPLNRL